MRSSIEGKRIYSIRHNGGLVAGQPETIEIHLTGGIMTVTEPEDVKLVNRLVQEAKRMGVEVNDYVAYMLVEEGW